MGFIGVAVVQEGERRVKHCGDGTFGSPIMAVGELERLQCGS